MRAPLVGDEDIPERTIEQLGAEVMVRLSQPAMLDRGD
jgi:hypothetical protein